MASLPFPPELTEQLVASIQQNGYAGLSAWMMVVWDYGKLTGRLFSPVTLSILVPLGPVISFDQEVSIIDPY